MKQIAKVLGRLIGVLIAEGVITQEDVKLILEPLREGDPDDRA